MRISNFLPCAGAVTAGLLVAVACSLSVDLDQARICRTALPALEGGATRLEVGRVEHGREPNTVRIEYRATQPGGAARSHHVVCRFAPVAPSAGRPDLVGITTDRFSVSPAALYLLKRYYLETADAAANDPGRGHGAD